MRSLTLERSSRVIGRVVTVSMSVCGAPMPPARLSFAARWRQHQSLVPLGAARADRSGKLLDPLAQAVGEIGTCEQAVTQRNGSVKVTSLRPATGGTEAMDKRFLSQALRLTGGAQPFFDLGGLGKLLGRGFILLLLAQQLGFQNQARFACFLRFERCIQTPAFDAAC